MDPGQADIKEIQLKSYKSSTSKKNKEQQGQIMEAKGILEQLQDQASTILKKDFIEEDLKEIKNLSPEKNSQLLLEIFQHCELVKKKTMKTLLFFFQEPQQISQTIEMLDNNFIDFKKYFYMFLKPLAFLKQKSKTLQ